LEPGLACASSGSRTQVGPRGRRTALKLELEEKNSNLFERYGLPVADFAGHGGCFPIRVRGAGVIGSITISGLPDREDHQLAVESLCTELGLSFEALRLQ
jgi:uncharacterized protein (UPF0303 family)